MGTVVTCERFLLLRAASQQMRAAKGMRELAGAIKHLETTVRTACDHASKIIDEASELSAQRAIATGEMRGRTLQALESGDIAAMEAERDRLMEQLRRGCNRCPKLSPFDCGPCCKDRQD